MTARLLAINKEADRQTERLTDRKKAKEKKEYNNQKKKMGGYNVSARDTFSEKLLKQYSTYY